MKSLLDRLVEALGRRGVRVWVVIVGLAIPLAFLGSAVADTEEPGFDPHSRTFEIEDRVDEVFADPDIRSATFLVDRADGGDVLEPQVLAEIADRSRAAASDPTHATHLTTAFDFEMDLEVNGLASVAGDVGDRLGNGEEAGDVGPVGRSVGQLLEASSTRAGLRLSLAESAMVDDGGRWSSPAFLVHARYDVSSFEAVDDDDRDRMAEQWLRELQADLGDGLVHARLIGVGIDGILTGEEQVTAGAPFIFVAVALIVLLVAALLRSYWAATIAAAAIATSLVLYGIVVALAGVSTGSSLIVFVVPMTLIAFGVDFFVHAAERIREQQHQHPRASAAATYSAATRSAGPALSLAAATSVAAFLSNGIAGIEAIVQFGLAASAGLVISFVMLGVIAPRALIAVESAPVSSSGGAVRLLRWLGCIVMALVAGIVVSIAAAIPSIGAVALVIFFGCFVLGPQVVRSRRTRSRVPATTDVAASGADGDDGLLTRAIEACTRRRRITIAGFTLFAAAGGLAATQVEAAFEVSDFFSSDSDFIVGLDRNDRYFGAMTGAPAYIYLEGDLTDPAHLRAMAAAVDSIGGSDAPLARNADGRLVVAPAALDVVRATMGSEIAVAQVEAAHGVLLDADGDGWPDSARATAAIFRSAHMNGVTADDGTTLFTPAAAGLAVAPVEGGYATRLEVIVTTFTDDDRILAARDRLEQAATGLAAAIGATDVTIGISGDVIASQESLAAFTRAMVVSLPVALLLTMLILGLSLRSVRFSFVSLIPILVVVAAIWGYMALRGFTINVVTATIAAIAVGVGIDFCTHFTVRYRSELAIGGDPLTAVRRTASGTGGALATSALTSVLGFGVMALAPAPIFSSFGELMAVMILLSAAAALFVLPSLLVLASTPRSLPVGLRRVPPKTSSAVGKRHRTRRLPGRP